MEKQYNLYNLEPSFKKYLLTENISLISLKNYLSDFRHFAGWVTFYLRSQNVIAIRQLAEKQSQKGIASSSRRDVGTPRDDIGEIINPRVINEYRAYLIENRIPNKTINRRLSTIRKFCSFCISQGWIKENPAKKILNISPLSSRPSEARGGILKKDSSTNARNDILSQFKKDLEKEKLDQPVITSYLDDIREFLSI